MGCAKISSVPVPHLECTVAALIYCFFERVKMKQFLLGMYLIGVCALYSNEKKTNAFVPEKECKQFLQICENTSRMSLAHAIRELTVGVVDPYFGEDFLSKIEEMQKRQPSGEYVEYWENGQIKARGSYKNGYADGHIHGWYEDGTDAFKGFFKEGVKLGVHIAFYPPLPGNEQSWNARILTFNSEGKTEGKQQACYPNRRLLLSASYKNGVLDGPKEVYDSEGGRIERKEYKKGKLLVK